MSPRIPGDISIPIVVSDLCIKRPVCLKTTLISRYQTESPAKQLVQKPTERVHVYILCFNSIDESSFHSHVCANIRLLWLVKKLGNTFDPGKCIKFHSNILYLSLLCEIMTYNQIFKTCIQKYNYFITYINNFSL